LQLAATAIHARRAPLGHWAGQALVSLLVDSPVRATRLNELTAGLSLFERLGVKTLRAMQTPLDVAETKARLAKVSSGQLHVRVPRLLVTTFEHPHVRVSRVVAKTSVAVATAVAVAVAAAARLTSGAVGGAEISHPVCGYVGVQVRKGVCLHQSRKNANCCACACGYGL
jgi:hypothetical protein